MRPGRALPPTRALFVFVPPLAGRWYDRAGGRPPLIAGFATLLAATVLLAWGVHSNAYLPVFPGLLLYGIALALILTVNDPVGLTWSRPVTTAGYQEYHDGRVLWRRCRYRRALRGLSRHLRAPAAVNALRQRAPGHDPSADTAIQGRGCPGDRHRCAAQHL